MNASAGTQIWWKEKGGQKMEQQLHNLDLAGNATASGGQYQDVNIQGVGNIHGDMECARCRVDGVANMGGAIKAEVLHIRGKATVEGDVTGTQVKVDGNSKMMGACTAKRIDIRGKTSIEGAVSSQELSINGFTAIGGRCEAKTLHIRGRARMGNSVISESVKIEGEAKIAGDCEAETFRSDGAFAIKGLLNAGKVSIRLGGASVVKEIGGEDIRVEKAWRRLPLFGWLGRSKKLVVETIEGDDIYLEYTQAKVVRGNRVHIGPGAEVDLVEYRADLQMSKEAKVIEHRQV
jgi:cytoskeletal protein CcmA (bactofilin family)